MISIQQVQHGINQLYPSLPLEDACAWVQWIMTQSNYRLFTVGKSVCIVKVYDQIDPPWTRVAHEVAWWGHGRDAVRSLHRGMDWARLQGASLFGYSLAPQLGIVKWRRL